MMTPPAIDILGVPVHPLTVSQLHDYIAAVIDRGERARVLNVNAHCMNLAVEQPWLHGFLNGAEIVFCDGAGVILGARLLGHHIPERITYADWMWQLAEFAESHGYSLYFLGARPGVAQAAADRLQQHYPGLRIAGVQHGYFDQTPGHPDNQAVVERINAARPNILLMGMGMPRQERWVCENWDALNVNIALTGGAVFDYMSGELQRAPRWMTDHGLEWLGRLLIEPQRLWRRYLVGNPLFLGRILRTRLGRPRHST
jgi:N-acetylglucosaminyldiphosphoundecaprenol N-acetyl-beta-D-mannosaminyltransferase